jgi:hypothetical protein
MTWSGGSRFTLFHRDLYGICSTIIKFDPLDSLKMPVEEARSRLHSKFSPSWVIVWHYCKGLTSLIVSSCSETKPISLILYWISRENRLEQIELSNINEVSLALVVKQGKGAKAKGWPVALRKYNTLSRQTLYDKLAVNKRAACIQCSFWDSICLQIQRTMTAKYRCMGSWVVYLDKSIPRIPYFEKINRYLFSGNGSKLEMFSRI